MVRVPDLTSGDLEFKSRSDHQLDLFQVILGSTPRLRLYNGLPAASWDAYPVKFVSIVSFRLLKAECL